MRFHQAALLELAPVFTAGIGVASLFSGRYLTAVGAVLVIAIQIHLARGGRLWPRIRLRRRPRRPLRIPGGPR